MPTLLITKCGEGSYLLGSLVVFVSMLNMLTFLGAGMIELAHPFRIVFLIGIGITWIAGACWTFGLRTEERNRMNAIAHQTSPIEIVT